MVKGPGSSTVAVGVLNYLRIPVFCVADRVNAPVRHGIRVIQGYFLNISVIQCTGVYMFCNSENLLFIGIGSGRGNLLIKKPISYRYMDIVSLVNYISRILPNNRLNIYRVIG